MPKRPLDELLIPGQSPYAGMYTAGRNGYSIEEVVSHCTRNMIPLREKDIRSWQEGSFKYKMITDVYYQKRDMPGGRINPFVKINNSNGMNHFMPNTPRFDTVKLEDLPMFPDDWTGTDRRFFPCTKDNRPMQPWGWKPSDPVTGAPVFDPHLMPMADAKALSPCGWVGHNLLYQRFIVMDIDGVGHGCIDEAVIQFGNLFRNSTLTYEDPKKPGSFHLYFKTDRLIPIKHFPHAKLDLMGNATNTAVYFKNKVSNGVPIAELTPQIWNAMMRYQIARKER